MNRWIFKIGFFGLFLLIGIISCQDKELNKPDLLDEFDRSEMLKFWAKDIIIPGYEAYSATLERLKVKSDAFYSEPSETRFIELRSAWLDAYLAWQDVAMFEIGKAEEIGLRNFTNIYPANESLILSNLESNDYNLELPSNFAAQGFPALDFLLFGIGESDVEIIQLLQQSNYALYLQQVINRLNELTKVVLVDWKNGFQESFISNSGSSATASTDKMVNDFVFHYEKFLRAAKVGIPAGIFSGTVEPNRVEANYASDYSKDMFNRNFTAIRNFFSGISYDGNKEGMSLKQYLDKIHQVNKTDLDYSDSILAQWNAAVASTVDISDSFKSQVIEDNAKMLELYDDLQKAVVLLKVDMLQALNIQVDYVDADGD